MVSRSPTVMDRLPGPAPAISSGKKSAIGCPTPSRWPRSMAIPTRIATIVFDADFRLAARRAEAPWK